MALSNNSEESGGEAPWTSGRGLRFTSFEHVTLLAVQKEPFLPVVETWEQGGDIEKCENGTTPRDTIEHIRPIG